MHIKKVKRFVCLTLVFGLMLTSGALSFAEEIAPEGFDDDASVGFAIVAEPADGEIAVPTAEVLWTGVTSSVAGGTSWPQGSANPNANQVVTLSWSAANDSADEVYSVYYGETANIATEPAIYALSPAVPAKNAAGSTWSAATTIKSGTIYWFYVESSARGGSNTITQAARNGVGPDYVAGMIAELPSDPKDTTMEDRYNLVLIRKQWQKLTAFDRAYIPAEIRHFQICEAYFMYDWVKGVYEQFKLAPGAAPGVENPEYTKWRAATEVILSREGTQWFMRWGSAEVHEYGHNIMQRDPELRQILADTGTTAMLDRMDELRDQLVAERQVIYAKVKAGVQAQIEAMDPCVPDEVATARAAYDALSPYERTYVTNLFKLLEAEGKSIVPPNIKSTGMRADMANSGTYSIQQWDAMSKRMVEQFPGTRTELVWIIVTRNDSAGIHGGGCRAQFTFASLLDRVALVDPHLVDRSSANAANHTYKGKTEAQWLTEGISFQTGTAAAFSDGALKYFEENGIYVYLQISPYYSPMLELIDMTLYRYSEYSCVLGTAVDVEWHMGMSEDSGIMVSDARARDWNLQMKKHNPGYRLVLKDYEATRLPWNYRGEPGEEDMIFCIDAQSFGDLDGTTVGYYEANGAWYDPVTYPLPVNQGGDNWNGKLYARNGMPVGNQTFYHDWSVYFYPNQVLYQFGYTGDRHWMGALPMPYVGMQNMPYQQHMASNIAWQAPLDQNIGVAWVNFNFTGFTGFPGIFQITPANLGGQVNTALGLLAQSGDNMIGQRFTNPNRETLYGGGPVLNDALYVRRMREMVNEADAKGWTGISAANRARLELLEPMAIDVRIGFLPALDDLQYGNRFTVNTLLEDYNALTSAQKAQVANAAALFAAKARIDEIAVVYAEIRAAEGAVVVNKPASLSVSLTNFTDINLVTVEFTFDADYLNFAGVDALTALNGFSIMSASISAIYGSSFYKGEVVLMAGGVFLSSADAVDVLRIDGLAKGKIGDAVVKLTDVSVFGKKSSGLSGEMVCKIIAPEAEIAIVDWTPVFSKYDLNKGPLSSDRMSSAVDAIDLSIAVYFYQMRSADADWETPGFNNVAAKQADVNASGIVNLADLIEIMANYGVYSTFPG